MENRKTRIRLIQQIFKLKHLLQRRPRNKQEIIILCSFHKENFNLILCLSQKVRYRKNTSFFFINKGTQFELCGFLHFLIADKRWEKEETSCSEATSVL